MKRLPGQPLRGEPLTPSQTTALGKTLRKLYDVPLREARAGITERLYGPTTQRQAVTEWLSDSYALDECRDPGLVAGAIDAALAWLGRGDAVPEPHLVALGIADLNPGPLTPVTESMRDSTQPDALGRRQ
jgi:hypothetical protein